MKTPTMKTLACLLLTLIVAAVSAAEPDHARLVSAELESVRLVSGEDAEPGEDPVTFARDLVVIVVGGDLYEVDAATALDVPGRPGCGPTSLYWWHQNRRHGTATRARMVVRGHKVLSAKFGDPGDPRP